MKASSRTDDTWRLGKEKKCDVLVKRIFDECCNELIAVNPWDCMGADR